LPKFSNFLRRDPALFTTKKFRMKTKLVIATGIAALAVMLVLTVPIYAMAQQADNSTSTGTGNSGNTGTNPIQIQGSVKISSIIDQILSQAKTSLGEASDAAAKAANGTAVSGRLGIVNGFLVYDMQVKASDGMHRVLVDAGNGTVLYISPAHQIGNGMHFFGGWHGNAEQKIMKQKHNLDNE
jgi:uncharacterized membrane protein YkoI